MTIKLLYGIGLNFGSGLLSQRIIQHRLHGFVRVYISALSVRCKSNAVETSHRELKKKNRPPGGGRFLTNPAQVYDYNNWDNVEWDEEQELEARRTVEENSNLKLDPDKQLTYEVDSAKNWDNFYGQHQNKFFKDRHWLFTEFPELETLSGAKNKLSENLGGGENCAGNSQTSENLAGGKSPESYPGELAKTRMLEVGCGVGNTVFPVLETNNDPELFMYCCDLSDNAIQLVKTNKDYNPQRCHAFVFDITDAESKFPFPEESLDVVVLIFVLSAINPEKFPQVINRLKRALKPGGLMLFRDYGRYDLTQLRFKKGRCLGDNFYVRGDGTKVYFFTQEELRDLFTKREGLVEEQNIIDRRLQVNRGRQIKMYRVWIQCKYRKPKDTDRTDPALQ